MKLYEIPVEASEIEAQLYDNIGELTPELEQRILAFLAQGKEKIESATIVVNSLEEDAEICQAEAKRLIESTRWFVITFGTDTSLTTGVGWDNVTCVGTPNGASFVNALAP